MDGAWWASVAAKGLYEGTKKFLNSCSLAKPDPVISHFHMFNSTWSSLSALDLCYVLFCCLEKFLVNISEVFFFFFCPLFFSFGDKVSLELIICLSFPSVGVWTTMPRSFFVISYYFLLKIVRISLCRAGIPGWYRTM